jgi:hypothetical protein
MVVKYRVKIDMKFHRKGYVIVGQITYNYETN